MLIYMGNPEISKRTLKIFDTKDKTAETITKEQAISIMQKGVMISGLQYRDGELSSDGYTWLIYDLGVCWMFGVVNNYTFTSEIKLLDRKGWIRHIHRNLNVTNLSTIVSTNDNKLYFHTHNGVIYCFNTYIRTVESIMPYLYPYHKKPNNFDDYISKAKQSRFVENPHNMDTVSSDWYRFLSYDVETHYDHKNLMVLDGYTGNEFVLHEYDIKDNLGQFGVMKKTLQPIIENQYNPILQRQISKICQTITGGWVCICNINNYQDASKFFMQEMSAKNIRVTTTVEQLCLHACKDTLMKLQEKLNVANFVLSYEHNSVNQYGTDITLRAFTWKQFFERYAQYHVEDSRNLVHITELTI